MMGKIEPQNYKNFFEDVVSAISSERFKAFKAINKHHIALNFAIGELIVKNQELHGWGKSVVNQLSNDLKKKLDGSTGYSPHNLWRMRQFFLEYNEDGELLELALQVPWGQNILIFQKLEQRDAKRYYLEKTVLLGWSRAVLLNQIKAKAYQRQIVENKQSNFDKTLPVHLSEQANESLRSEYNLDFLGITEPVLERELENRLVANIRDLIMELGYGFCFIGNQYRLRLNQKEYYVDLLFYHRILKCLIALELKVSEFRPEFAGKMNFYLELLDEQIKEEDDNPSIGIIICPEKDGLEVEYALRNSSKPIGVAEYRLTPELPENLRGKIPTSNEFHEVLDKAKKSSK